MAEKPTYEELSQRVQALEQEKLENNNMIESIIHSEQWLTHKIESEMNPEIHISDVELDAIINAEEIQAIMDEFCHLTNMVTAILDLKGKVIESTGWQDICLKFHRINTKTALNCTASDLSLTKKLKPGESVGYKCKNGLWDVVTPLYVGNKHLGNIYTGQFFYDDDDIDEKLFIKQAEAYGFDKVSYLDALRRVPRYNRETIKHLMGFLVKFATYISKIGFFNIQLEKEIHERKRVEVLLLQEHELYLDLVNTQPAGIYRVRVLSGKSLSEEKWSSSEDPPYIIELVSDRFCELLKLDKQVFEKNPGIITSLVYEADRAEFARQNVEANLKRIPFVWEGRLVIGGEIRWVSFESRPRPLESGDIVWTGILYDITKRKRAEEEKEKLENQLFQAQKMESVGRLAGGVAHDYNNMLSLIMGYAELGLLKVDPNDPLSADLAEILKAAKRSTNITRQLLAFARQQTIAPQILELNETVESMLKMLRRLIGEDIDLAWLPKAKLWPVKIDPSQVDQILANLCVNARDAIAGVGKVTIETGNAVFDEAYVSYHSEVVPGEYVLLAVSDDGSGIAPETLDKIFEPFFTTKELGKGTGLGMATVYGIVKQNNGFINVYSELEKGTTIKIYLPRYTGHLVKAPSESTTVIPLSRGETVLLVEDEVSILKLGRTILESLGYIVLTASTPGEAIDLAREHTGEINLLLTDVVMPGMNGRDLSNQLQPLYPNLKTLFMSGYTANVIAHRGVLDDGVCFMPKPFSKKDLGIKVREALEQV